MFSLIYKQKLNVPEREQKIIYTFRKLNDVIRHVVIIKKKNYEAYDDRNIRRQECINREKRLSNVIQFW